MPESIIPVDEKCTAWVQEVFGYSMKACCVTHDYGGSDEQLLECVAGLAPFGLSIPMALLMYIGVKNKWAYKLWLKFKQRIKQ